jgi:hypothetical protein
MIDVSELEKQIKTLNEQMVVQMEKLKVDEDIKSDKYNFLVELRAKVDRADFELNEAKRELNQTDMRVRQTRNELFQKQSDLEKTVFENDVEAFIGQQDTFEEVFKNELVAYIEEINKKAKLSVPIDGQASYRQIISKVNRKLDFEDITLDFRASKTKYAQELREIAEISVRGGAIPIPLSLNLFGVVESYVKSNRVQRYLGIQ